LKPHSKIKLNSIKVINRKADPSQSFLWKNINERSTLASYPKSKSFVEKHELKVNASQLTFHEDDGYRALAALFTEIARRKSCLNFNGVGKIKHYYRLFF
jgi:hypothetical protein